MKLFLSDNITLSEEEKWNELPDGRLIIPVTLTRTGIFLYKYSDIFPNGHDQIKLEDFENGIIKVYRSKEEVLSTKSLNSMKGMYFTNEHPIEEVNSSNYNLYEKGTFSTELSIREEAYNDYSIWFVDSFLILKNDDIKALIKSKEKEQISLGYTMNLKFLPGVFGGVNYHACQEDIENNHGALVQFGRAGSSVKIKTRLGDLNTVFELDKNFYEKKEKQFFMYIKGKKLTLDELSETLIQQELDEKDNSNKTLNQKVKAVDSLEAKVLKLEKDLQDAKSIDVEAMVQDRLTVISKAKAYLKDADFTNKSLVEVKAMVVSDHYKKDFTGKSEGVIAELFDLLDEKPAVQQKQTLSDSFKGSGSEDANKLDPQNIIVNRLLKAYDSVEKKEQK